jgi:hypothetical protein
MLDSSCFPWLGQWRDRQIWYLVAQINIWPIWILIAERLNIMKCQSCKYIPDFPDRHHLKPPISSSPVASVHRLGLITQTTFLNQDEFFKYTSLGAMLGVVCSVTRGSGELFALIHPMTSILRLSKCCLCKPILTKSIATKPFVVGGDDRRAFHSQ